MLRIALISLLSVGLIAIHSSAAQENSVSSKLGFGMQLGQYQDDFGIGLHLTSPYFLHNNIALRVRGNIMWNEHPGSDNKITWSSYSNLSFGLIGVAGRIKDFARLYSEGGIIFLYPSSNFSTANYEIGGYGLFGFEFFFDPKMNYFIEIGGVGTGAIKDKIPGEPIYSNGLMVNVGFRYAF